MSPEAPESMEWESLSSDKAACMACHASSADNMSVSHCLLGVLIVNSLRMLGVMRPTSMLGEQNATFLFLTGFAGTK